MNKFEVVLLLSPEVSSSIRDKITSEFSKIISDNEGKIIKGCHIKVSRDGEVVYEGILSSLKQFKQDVAEIEQDSECGIYVEEFDEWKEDDIISAFELVEKKKNR